MQNTVQHGRNLHLVFEDFGPSAKVLIGGDDEREFLIGLADQPEQEVSLAAIDFQVSELVQYQNVMFDQLLLKVGDLASGGGYIDLVHEISHGGKVNFVWSQV